MAYAALISLEHTIDHLLNSPDIWIVPRYQAITECKDQVKSSEKVLQRLDDSNKSRSRKKVNALDEQIKEAASRFEDVLEFYLSHQILKQTEENESRIQLEHENRVRFFNDMQYLKKNIQSFTERMMMEMNELTKMFPEKELKNLVHSASTFEDVLAFSLSNQVVSVEQSKECGNRIRVFVDMQYLKQHVEGSIIGMKKMEEEYIKELKSLLPEEDDGDGGGDDDEEEEDDDLASSRFDRERKSEVVGLSNELSKLKVQLTSEHKREVGIRTLSVLGMAGIGKTTLANEVFKDSDISDYFHHRVWVTVGIKYHLEKIQQDIRCQVNPEMNIKESLEGKSYLIVLDDVWDTELLSKLKPLLPFRKNGSAILLTTRLQEVCEDSHRSIRILKMQLLNGKDSWDLLREEVFGKESCPPQLENPGKKIAQNCEGLPLTIVTVARLLLEGPMDPEHWNEVAEEKNSVFQDAYNEISKVLYPSYKYLPQHLKACFLYMGVFLVKYKIPRSKLINMWIAEGFLEQYKMLTAEEWGVKCLEGLFSNNVAMLYQHSSVESRLGEQIKTCGLHASFWHLCNREASKSKFFYALNSLEDCAKDGIESQRRLCFRNNILFGIQQDMCDSMGDDRAPSARSLVCYGPYHQYQVPVWYSLRLLRVVDALNIRFYEFPIQVLKLVLLKYFALTFNGDLPSSISKLWKLQYFIVRRHMSIKSCKAPSYLPMEIWDMKELKHLEVIGSDLQVPSRSGTLLPNLQKLVGVSARSCSKEILGRISNLQKLSVQIELGHDADDPLRWFDHISHFRELGSLKCVIVNPEFKVVAPPPPLSVFPWGLKRLTLSGLGYSWEDMEAIASFRNLEVLKLQCYAFRGPKWKIKARKFMNLSSLMIEDTDLVQWELRHESLPSLVNLSLKHCYKLKEIHWEHDKYFRPKIEIEDCNPLGVACVKQIMEAASGNAHFVPHVTVHSSYMD